MEAPDSKPSDPKVMDRRWMRRLILLDALLALVLAWLAFTVWEEAQRDRAQAAERRPEQKGPAPAIESGFDWQKPGDPPISEEAGQRAIFGPGTESPPTPPSDSSDAEQGQR